MTSKVSLVVLAYNQEDFVKRAIDSAISQDYPFLEILLSDDFSTDRTYNIMRDVAAHYCGPHKIALNRTATNRGIVGHFNEAMALATGDIVVYLAGDDISARDRVSKLVAVLNERSDLSFVESGFAQFKDTDEFEHTRNHHGMDSPVARGRIDHEITTFDLSDYCSGRAPLLSSSTRAFRRDVLLNFPDLNSRLASEDSCTALRLLFFGNGGRINEPLLHKRVHNNNLTGPDALRRMNFDLIGAQYVSDAERAVDLGRLTDNVYKEVLSWASHIIERRKLRVLFDLGFPSVRQLWREILPSRHLAFREKIFAIRRLVRGLFQAH